MSSIARILACAQTQGAKRPTPTQSTCLYYDHDNEASKCVPFAGSMQCSPDGLIMLPHSGERAVEESFRFSVVLKCVELRQNCQQFHQLKEIV